MKNLLPVLLLCVVSKGIAQTAYKPPYAELKTYQGVYEYANHKTLEIAASPVDSLLYALIGDSRYKLRPYSKDVFLNNGNEQVIFVRSNGVIAGYKQQGDKPDTTYKLVSTKITFSDKMWYPRPVTGHKFQYTYTTPQKKNDGLPTGTIVNSGLDTGLIHALVNRIVDGTYPGVHSVLIIKHGKLIFEEYFYEYDADKLHELRSATKSFSSALVGIAINKGLIKGVNEPMLQYLPEYKNLQNPDPRKSRITIKNLLTQQSGFACYDYDQKSPGAEEKMYPTDDWIKFMLDLPMAGNPGEASSYCSGNIQLLDKIVENVSHQSLHDFAAENLFGPMGITDFKWDYLPNKTHEDDYGQVLLTPRDMAKFGLLYLNGGVWNGKQVVPKDYVTQALSYQSIVEGMNYGYLWWCDDLKVNGITYEGRAAKGNGGQRIFIWPKLNMVAVVTAGNYNTQSPANKLLMECVLGGVK
jgi:CubicO group peptidase (beta-lactamase class C family)